MNLFILISFIYLWISLILFRKTKNELSIVTWIVASFVIMLCYNTFLTSLMTLIHLPINFLTYTIITSGIASFLLYRIILKGDRQKYYYSKFEIIMLVIISVVLLVGALMYFGLSLNIKYQTTDPNVHYFVSNIFSSSDSLLFTNSDNLLLYNGQKSMMPLFYSNAGLLMKSFNPLVGEYYNYKLFVSYNIISFILAGQLLFATFIIFSKRKALLVIGAIAAILYAFGYPYNEMAFGFCYLGNAVLVINLLLILTSFFKDHFDDNSIFEKIQIIIFIFLGTYAIFFGYYFFIPFVYLGLFCYFIFYFLQKKLLFTRWFWITGLITLALPTILGVVIYVLPSLINVSSGRGDKIAQVGLLAMEGYIYRDLYSNFIFFIPFILYFYYISIKNKIFDILFWLLTTLLVYILFLFVYGMYGHVSSYYYFKNYFVLSMILFAILFYCFSKLYREEFVPFLNGLVASVLILLNLWYFNFDSKVIARNNLYNVDEKMHNFFDIYSLNRVYKQSYPTLDEDDIEVIAKMRIIIDNGLYKVDELPVLGNTLQRLWFFSMTKKLPNKNDNGTFEPFYKEGYSLEEFYNSKYEYIVVLDNKIKANHIADGFKVVFQNEGGFILKRSDV